jgi:polyferredoxin
MTAFGAYVFAPVLPVIRFDYPGTPGALDGGQRVCDSGILFRGLSSFWPFAYIIIAIAFLFLICAIFGRLLCGWICPIGLFQDLAAKIRTALKIKPREFSQKTHDKMTMAKYAILMLAILLATATGLSLLANYTAGSAYKGLYPEGTAQIAPFCAVCPAPSIYYMGSVFETGDFQFSDPTRFLAIGVLGIVLIGGFLTTRAWCRYFCPVGATSSFFNKISIISIRKDQKKCTKCNYCVSSCGMRIQQIREEDKKDRVMDMNCTFCLECIEACPEKALSLSLANKSFYIGGKDWWMRGGGESDLDTANQEGIIDDKDE